MNVLELPDGTKEDESELSITSTGSQLWYSRDANLHRISGPAAIIIQIGQEFWFRHGEQYEPTAHEKMLWELRKKNECS